MFPLTPCKTGDGHGDGGVANVAVSAQLCVSKNQHPLYSAAVVDGKVRKAELLMEHSADSCAAGSRRTFHQLENPVCRLLFLPTCKLSITVSVLTGSLATGQACQSEQSSFTYILKEPLQNQG